MSLRQPPFWMCCGSFVASQSTTTSATSLRSTIRPLSVPCQKADPPLVRSRAPCAGLLASWLRRASCCMRAGSARSGIQPTVHLGGPPRRGWLAPKQVLARRTPPERKRERRELGSLSSLVVAPRTLEWYFHAVWLFLEFLQMHASSYPSSFLTLDGRLCEYIEHLWQNGDSKAFASDCLSGLGHYILQCKKHLAGAWRLHGSWTRAELPARALPFTPVIVYALAQLSFRVARDTGRKTPWLLKMSGLYMPF